MIDEHAVPIDAEVPGPDNCSVIGTVDRTASQGSQIKPQVRGVNPGATSRHDRQLNAYLGRREKNLESNRRDGDDGAGG